MKTPFIIIAFVVTLFSCSKAHTIVITGNKSTAAVGEKVELTIDATSNKKFKIFVVDALLYSNSGVINTGRFYINEDKSKEVSDKFTFLIPEQVINQTIVPGDYYEFLVYAETGNEEVTTTWKVEVTP